MLMLSFMRGEARRIALDQVAFLFVCQFILEVVQEQLVDPVAQLLRAYGNAKEAQIIKMLVKPGEFFEQTSTPTRRYNLNQSPTPEDLKQKGIYANQTP